MTSKISMSESQDDEDFFFLTFVGEYVEVTTKLMATEPESKLTVPISFQGFLLEQDEQFYYIGPGPGNIAQAIKKELVGIFTIVNPENEMDTILTDFKPEREEEIN
jgi:hypothetical protein